MSKFRVRLSEYLVVGLRKKSRPKHRRAAKSWATAALLSVALSSVGLSAISAAPAQAAVTTTSQPDVAGSNTTISYLGSPIREGATLAGGTTIGIGTSALLNPGVGSREIRTSYNSNTVYQAGTARAPEGWTLSYSTNNGANWSSTEPVPASGVTDIRATASSVAAGVINGYSQQYSTETSATIPSSTFSASTGGDGWGVTFLDDYVFNIYHHGYETRIDCHIRSTGARCLGESGGPYPKLIRDASGNDFWSSARSDLVADAATGKLYSLTSQRTGVDANNVGMLCISVTSTPQFCGFTVLSTTLNTDGWAVAVNGTLTEPVRVGNKIFGVHNPNIAELVCFDLDTNQKCANSPVTIDTTASSTRLEKVGTQLFIKANQKMHCIQATTMQSCGSPWPQNINSNTTSNAMIAVHTNANGVEDGICSSYNCFNLAGVAQNWVNPYSINNWINSDVWFKGVTALGRHYFGDGSVIHCFDYSTQARCTGFTSTRFGYLYEIEVDPENPACLWTDEDAGRIVNMDAYTGNLGCGANPVITLQPSKFAPRYACSTAQGIDKWGLLRISSLVGGGLASSIRLTVRDANGNPVTGFTDRAVSLNTDLDMTSMNISLSGSRPTFSFAFSGITGSITSATIALDYEGKGPELCSTAVLSSPAQVTAVAINSKSIDSVGLVNLYESRRNFNIGSATIQSNLYFSVPSAPLNLVGTGLNTNATLTFAPPADNGGLDLGDYFYSLDGGTTYQAINGLADNGNGTYSVSLTGLTPGQTYAIRVAASNSLGRGLLASLTLTAQVVAFSSIPDTYQNAGPIYLQTQNSDSLPYTYVASPSSVCTVSVNVVTLVAPGTCNLTQNQSGDATHLATTSAKSFRVLTNPVVVVAPEAPISLAATPSSTQVALSWQTPANNGNGAITDYVVQYKVGSSWVPLVDGVTTNTFAVVTGLTNGVTYSFKVAAVNSAGQGAFSAAVNAVPASIPNASTGLSADQSAGTSAALSWTAPSSDGGSAITDYLIEFKLSSDPTWSTFTDAVSTAASASVTGLNNASTYDFQVTPKNAVGFGAPVSTVTLVVTSQSASVALSWPTNSDNAVISNHKIEYRLAGSNVAWTQVDTGSTSRSATLSPLTNGTSYEIRVARITGTGGSAVVSSYTSTVLGTPVTTPGAPVVTASAGVGQVQLAWSASVANGSEVFDYIARYRLTGANVWTTWTDGVSASTSVVVFGLTNGSNYEFQVAAQNLVGVGSYSSTVTSTPRTTPGAITGLALTVTGVTMTLSWSAPANNGGASITDYVIEYKLLADTNWNLLTRAASTSLSGSISGLNPTTRYSVRVAAVNAAGIGSFGAAGSELTGVAPPVEETAMPLLQSTSKQVVKHMQREKVELKFIRINDVKSVKVEGKEVDFKVVEGVVSFVDPGLSLGMKDVVVAGSWGTLTFAQVVEVVKSAGVPSTAVAKSLRISGFAPGMSTLTNSIISKINKFVKSMTSPMKLTCQGSTSGPTVLKVDKSLAETRAAKVCKYIKTLNSSSQYKTTSLNTIWMSPLARNVTLKYSE